MPLDRLKELFRQQTELVTTFGHKESELQAAILARDWDGLKAMVPSLESLSQEIAAVDGHRHVEATRVKEEAGLAEEAPFPELLTRVDALERDELAQLYRELQVAVLRVRSVTNGIDSYVRGSVRATNEMLGELFPEHKGSMYSKQGRTTPVGGRAMVLDHRL